MKVQLTVKAITHITMEVDVKEINDETLHDAMTEVMSDVNIDLEHNDIVDYTIGESDVIGHAEIENVSNQPEFEDVDIIEVADLEPEFAQTFPKAWAVQYANGKTVHCDTEIEASLYQQEHRVLYGKNPETGE